MCKERTALSSLFLLVAANGKNFWEKSASGIASAAEFNGILGKNFAENYGVKIWERKIFGKLWRDQERKKTLIRR